MKVISAELVEETWREVGSNSRGKAIELMSRIGRTQRELLSFVLVFTQELGSDAHELSAYLFTVIYRMYEKAAETRIRTIKPKEIQDAYEKNEKFMERFINADERFLKRAADSIASAQPFVVQYLVEAIFEAPENPEDPLTLSEEETGEIFLTLKTVIDVLDHAASPRVKT
jgi:hypothetical protein